VIDCKFAVYLVVRPIPGQDVGRPVRLSAREEEPHEKREVSDGRHAVARLCSRGNRWDCSQLAGRRRVCQRSPKGLGKNHHPGGFGACQFRAVSGPVALSDKPIWCISPLRFGPLHGREVGSLARCEGVQPDATRRRTVGAGGQVVRRQAPCLQHETSQRLLPLANQDNRLQRSQFYVEERPGRRGAGSGRGQPRCLLAGVLPAT
jgi:hypothetical protein